MKISTNDINLFFESLQKIDEKRKESLKNSINTDLKQDLFTNGIAVAKSLFNQENLSELINFQLSIEKSLNRYFNCGGYIDIFLNSGNFYTKLNKVLPNHGQIRLQTKGMSFPMPGFHVFSQDKYLSDIFSWWNNVHDCPITRGTLEWIIPAPLNHNGWHKDMVRPQLKAFVLLGDVDLDTAPMYYAKRSHFIQNDFEKQVAFRMFKEGTLSKANYLPRRGNHYPAAVGAHSGFLSDDEAKNDPEEINDLPINLGGVKYEKFVCTGSLGDVIFFDSCGFHSGNISHGKIRRTISLSAPSVRSDVAIAFDEQNAKSV